MTRQSADKQRTGVFTGAFAINPANGDAVQRLNPVHEMGALARLHICGNTSFILADMAATGADIIDLDWMVDIGRAVETFGPNQSACGNQDPVAVMLQGMPETVRAGWTAHRRTGC